MSNEIKININKLVNGELHEKIKGAVNDACQIIENDAKKNCPVDDGTLRASITHNIEAKGDKLIGTIGSNMEYAPYVHEGTGIYAKGGKGRQTPWVYRGADGKAYRTSGQKPNPFLQDAIDKNKDKILNHFKGLF